MLSLMSDTAVGFAAALKCVAQPLFLNQIGNFTSTGEEPWAL